MIDKYRILSIVSIYHALNDGAVSVIPILFPIFKDIYNLNYTQIGTITSISLLVHLIAQLQIGRTADGKNFRTMLSLGVLLISISLLIITQTNGFFTLMVFLIFLRFSASFFHPIGVGWISRIFKNDKLDMAMGIQSGSADLGAFIALSTTLYITDIKNWDFPLYLWAIAAAITVIIGMILTVNINENKLYVKKTKKKQKIKEIIQENLVILKRIKILIPAYMISGSAWGIIITYLPLLLVEKTNLSLAYVGLVVSIWIGLGSLISFCYGNIQKIIGRKNVIIFAYLIIGLMSLLLSFVTNIFVILLIMILLGITVFLTYPALFSFTSEVTHESIESGTFGLVFTLQLGGGTILLFSGGFLADLFTIGAPFIILGLPSLLLSIILIVHRKKPFALR
jgi:FSR family fosmidomycin resistance protein-like MFS transporter